MKKNLLLIHLSILLFSFFSCKDEDQITEKLGCNPTNTTFNQLYQNLANNPQNNDGQTMDLETHAYTFEVSNNKTICKVGYQSLPNFNTTPYLIEIEDITTNTILYSASHLFSAASTSYVNITPINLQVNHYYTIRRVQTNWNNNINNTIGRLVTGNFSFPVVQGDLKITSSIFYGTGGPNNDLGIPYIDIVFE